jgi:preprotein translocase YajC subunit
MLPLLVLLGTIAGAWYLLIVRPQRDQQTRHGAVLAQLQLGDHVLTVGGIYGRIVAIEGPTVVIELAPGLTSRIASDGIARIVQGPEASLPAAPALAPAAAPPPAPPPPPPPAPIQTVPTPATTMDHSMQQPPHPQYQQPLVAHDGQGTTTLRAHVLPAAPVLAQPWRDVAPTATQQPYGHQPHAQVPQGGPVMPQGGPVMPQAMPALAHAAPVYAAPVQAAPMPAHAMHAPPPPQPWAPAPTAARPDFLPPPPVLQPFASVRIPPQAPQPQYASQPIQQVHQVAPTTQLPVMPQVAPHGIPAPRLFAQAAPSIAPVQPYVQLHDAAEAPVAEAPRRASQAPKGMGSSLRLDDPSLRDTMERARTEREGLAAEYRQLVAPLVDTSVQVAVAPAAPQQYPGPARTIAIDSTGDHGMPRPHVVAPSAIVDPALVGAFQHRTPYAMTQSAVPQAVAPTVNA